jgi:MerR family transcriptional regulator, light-induced transcriptional regulator
MGTTNIHLAGATLRRHRHLCGFFHTLDERYRVLSPFVKEGIERGEKAFHIVDPARLAEHLDRLQTDGIDVRTMQASGQLEVVGWDEAYLRDGRFDQDATLALLGRLLTEARSRGFPLTRVIGEMDWALQDPGFGVEKLIQYEARVNSVFADCRDPLVCTYDRTKFGASVAMDAFSVHPLGITGGVVQENPLLGGPIPFRRQRESGGVTRLRKRYLAALLAGGRRDALDIVVEEGLWLDVPVTTLYLEIIQPALYEVGRLWQCGRLSVARASLAAEICKVALAQLHLHLPCEPSNGRLVVVACVEGEAHDIGAHMVADFLEMAGFDVRFLGGNIPTETLVTLIEEQPPELLALSTTIGSNLGALRRVVESANEAGRGRVPIAAGGQLFDLRPRLRTELNNALYARTAQELVAAAGSLLHGMAH